MADSATITGPEAVAGASALTDFVGGAGDLVVLTGAGVSTDSGIPDYRDADGQWKHARPVQHRDFITKERTRKRYWARSMAGWPHISTREPNDAHRALAELESAGHVATLITQNVDGLHQKAGHANVIDLHGRLDVVVCLGCGRRRDRDDLQSELTALNPDWGTEATLIGPDGDAKLEDADFDAFTVPACDACGGAFKPNVVFFGDNVPADRVDRCMKALEKASALLVAGSSLMVYSGFRFAKKAFERDKPVALLGIGKTRADDLAQLKVEANCARALRRLAQSLT